ncbi:transglycosylase domain-containing protein [Adhaeribacter swui]|uniref:Transglycosylase domain-containing protein n=1 Tax=Adhaeribacter swui TaxID=2086471 RepID=A0A7G7GDI3_9BACT|nr:transglycosylase domain-containing protein [Adhaeribacter swui]QNF35217.1 transglycosylase domain-containing protein [Adhaeribacter swui]
MAEKQHKSGYQKVVNFLWRGFLVSIALLVIYVVFVSVNFLYLFGSSPGLEKLENPSSEIASELYTTDGLLIGKYFTENRSPVPYSKISPLLIKTLVATEDVRFYQHSGIDAHALGSILYFTLRGEKRGGSTITQQLAKNLYKTRTDDSRGALGHIPVLNTVISKTKEWTLAVQLERNYTKEEILAMYLNTVDFGSNSYGIKVAAKTFFSTSPDSLKPEEAAMMVGLVNAPSRYSPKFNPKNALAKRNFVIDKMAKYKIVSKVAADSLKALPIALKYKVEKHYEGPATYFRGAVNDFVKKWCEEENKKVGYEKYNIYTSGLKIYTTIDSRMQALAEQAVEEKMRDLQKKFNRHWKGKNPWVDEKDQEIPNFIETIAQRTEYYHKLKRLYGNDQAKINELMNTPRKMTVFTWQGEKDTTLSPLDSLRFYKRYLHAGMMTMDPFTGQIKAWVGGINFKYFKYDHVRQAKRQAGSTFKPFVYLTAIDNGYSPCDRIRDERITIKYVENGKPMEWQPNNVTRSYTGINMTLRQAMARSVNSVTAQLTEQVGWDRVAQYAHRLGISTPLQSVPSIGLGSGGDVSVYDMVSAYATFVNNGFRSDPMFVTRIEDRNGNVIHQFSPRQKKVISEETAFLMVHMLKGGMEEPGGTSQALWEYDLWKNGNEIGGKTGTTSNYSDGWYMGITKDLVSGVWVGGEDRSIHFRTSATGEGSKTALPIFGLFMEKLYKEKELGYKMGRFPKPTVKIRKNYYCPTPRYSAPKTDSLSTDQLLERLNDSLPTGI